MARTRGRSAQSGLTLILAIIPLGLGLLVLAPVMVLTTYTVYRDVFFEPTRQPTA